MSQATRLLQPSGEKDNLQWKVGGHRNILQLSDYLHRQGSSTSIADSAVDALSTDPLQFLCPIFVELDLDILYLRPLLQD